MAKQVKQDKREINVPQNKTKAEIEARMKEKGLVPVKK